MNAQFRERFNEYSRITDITKIFFVITLLLLLSILLFREYTTEVEKQKHIAISEKRDAEWRAKHDSATGLFNQKYFKTALQEEILRSHKYKRPLTLIMCDIDHFKKFNDTYGHLTGDEVLQMVAHIISDNVRVCDIVARYGGEEFSVLLLGALSGGTENAEVRHKNLTDETIQIASRIKGKIGQSRVRGTDKQVGLTISLGISSYNGLKDCDANHFIHEADQALYKSKENGRNQITFFDPATKEYKTYL
jgi:diguanylate cyclase (GGDEF)-like protein